ncbi:hypothetical protein [Pseudooceanicola sp.]|uniref:hypothetical protein n=1 Tax=Pseudooceanicola sp. TaxID=1914328 RepID=UPI0026142E51|nr:hypothetical protein [Pseudooceanicola sp.]MDF1854683.1 hypothetical protein [Pseudooceanicola sp.]
MANTLFHRSRTRIIGTVAVGVAIGGLALFGPGAMAQMAGHGGGMGMHRHGADGTGHDEAMMPGLRGLDATPEESADLATMFRNFPDITREVTNLPDGIRTITYSADEALMNTVVTHVVGMIDRVDEGRDPQIFIQSPTLDILFERRDRITTEIDVTDLGIVVVQTSDDPDVVAALQKHAGEVSDMANRGMAAVHDMMMARPGN